jgi:hypothetical protein
MPASFMLIMTTGPRPDALPDALPDAWPDALDPGFHGARTHWIRGFMAFQLARHTVW